MKGGGAVQKGGGELAISETKKTDSLPFLALENPSYRSIERVAGAIQQPGAEIKIPAKMVGEKREKKVNGGGKWEEANINLHPTA